MRYVTCLDDGRKYGFLDTKTPHEAMEAMLYTLNLERKDDKAEIHKTPCGMHLWFEHYGKTYGISLLS